jgi:hypothetical protein
MDDVLLNQWGNLVGATELTVLRPATVMLQNLMRYVEERQSGRTAFPENPVATTLRQPAGACGGEIVRSALPIAGVFRKMKIILA